MVSNYRDIIHIYGIISNKIQTQYYAIVIKTLIFHYN